MMKNKRSIKGITKQQYRLFIAGVKPAILFLKPLPSYQKELVDILMALNYPFCEYSEKRRLMFFQNEEMKKEFESSNEFISTKEGLALGFPKRSVEDHYFNLVHNSRFVLVDYHGINFVSDQEYVGQEIEEIQKTMPVPEHLQTGIRLNLERGKTEWFDYEEIIDILNMLNLQKTTV